MKINKILLIWLSMFVCALNAFSQEKPEREIQSSKGIVSGNSMYVSVGDKEAIPIILKVNLLGTGQSQRISLPVNIPLDEAITFRIKGNFLYAISRLVFAGGPQRIYMLEKYDMREFVLRKDGSLGPPSIRQIDIGKEILKRQTINVDPLEIGLHQSYNLTEFSYDFTINSDDSITLYMIVGTRFEIWRHSGVDDTQWRKFTEFQSNWNEQFSVLNQGTEVTLLTASGDVYNLNGKSLLKLTEKNAKLSTSANKDTGDPIFIENQDSDEHWIVTTKKSTDGATALSKSRSLKAGKAEDILLPNNIAAALNNALKPKK